MGLPEKKKRGVVNEAKKRAFVDALFDMNGDKQGAAEAVGYTKGTAAKNSANRLIKDAFVQRMIEERIRETLGAEYALQSLTTIAKLSKGAKSEYVQLQASQDLLDRAGYKAIDRSQVQVLGDFKVSIDLGE